MDDAGILPRRQVWLSLETAWEQISAVASVQGDDPLADSSTGLVGNLELDRPASLLLNDGGAITHSSASEHVIDPQPDEIAAPEFAVDRQIEHWQVARPSVHLQSRTDRPYMFWPSGGFWPIRLPLFQGSRRGVEDIACV